MILVGPLTGDRRADIRLVEMIGGDDLDRLAGDLAAEILDRHLSRRDGTLAPDIGVEGGHVAQHADLDDVIRDLRLCGREGGGAEGKPSCGGGSEQAWIAKSTDGHIDLLKKANR